jgi:molecular chaperone DnaK (HSP70)
MTQFASVCVNIHFLVLIAPPPQIENLLGDERDYSGVVTRDEFERECADLFEHLLPPLRHVLTSSNLTSVRSRH